MSFIRVSVPFQTRIQCTTLSFSDAKKKKTKTTDNKRVFAAALTDLSKVFDFSILLFINNKIKCFDKKYMSFTSAYIYKRKQKPKVGTEFNDFQKIFFGVPTGSILGTILFFIFIVDIFFY